MRFYKEVTNCLLSLSIEFSFAEYGIEQISFCTSPLVLFINNKHTYKLIGNNLNTQIDYIISLYK